MAKLITVNDFIISDILIDVLKQKMIVKWQEITEIGTIYRMGEVTIWVTMPLEENPGNWILMPSGMRTFLANEIPQLATMIDPIVNPI